MPALLFSTKDTRAVIPSKAHHDDIGYDLTIIEASRISDKITMFDTGISVKPPSGYYTEVVPRSSFGKSGYVLANSIGIIDPQYRGTLKVVLIKVDDSAKDITLPFKGFQLILRKAETCEVQIVDELDQTERGDGGFGSTDSQRPMADIACAQRHMADIKYGC